MTELEHKKIFDFSKEILNSLNTNAIIEINNIRSRLGLTAIYKRQDDNFNTVRMFVYDNNKFPKIVFNFGYRTPYNVLMLDDALYIELPHNEIDEIDLAEKFNIRIDKESYTPTEDNVTLIGSKYDFVHLKKFIKQHMFELTLKGCE